LLPISNESAETVLWNNAVPEKSKVYINPSIASIIKSFSQESCLKQRCSGEVKSLHQSVNHFQYQIKKMSIHQSLPISNHSADTVVWNNTVPEKSKVYINPSIASNIKSFSRDSSLKQRCSREVKSLHQSVNRFQYQIIQLTQFFETTLFPRSQKFTSIRQSLPISNNLADTVHWNNAVPEKSKVYINPSIASKIKSFSRHSSLKQRCSREGQSLHQSVNRFQSVPISNQKMSIRQSLPISNQSAKTVLWNKHCSREVKSLHQSVNRFQYQIIQPTQFFETTLFPRSQKFKSIRQLLPISNHSADTVLWNNAVLEKSKVYINPSIASNIKSFSQHSCLK
jgi:hypothetical protein